MLTINIDSYVTVSQADSIITSHVVDSAAWQKLSAKQKEIYLLNACITIDNLILSGKKHSITQCLQFPRDLYTQVPTDICVAQSLEAYALTNLQSEHRRELIQQGVTSIKLGNAAESYDTDKSKNIMHSSGARHIMMKYLAGSVAIV